MRYRLRTLLIVLALGPPMLAVHYFIPELLRLTIPSVAALIVAAIADAIIVRLKTSRQ